FLKRFPTLLSCSFLARCSCWEGSPSVEFARRSFNIVLPSRRSSSHRPNKSALQIRSLIPSDFTVVRSGHPGQNCTRARLFSGPFDGGVAEPASRLTVLGLTGRKLPENAIRRAQCLSHFVLVAIEKSE